ncbi:MULTISPECIES: ABC transporter substrate-binding protein [Brevibacillus]|uniref:ABC transporter substrate-binding protein n=1 Tax=Brevibacillus TaxID=55080 RepID=UPI001FAA0FEB|nr:ABC transporter substrate-binding protein [Brevibacillus borstelensis]MCM3621075.1 ABC transporter substrate-binding protein [Brevibacillus borstelensis]MED2006895.1 ABC transporter substrate-binding protein [Brevibacillus borstelensis]WNF07983.1 ABC transporter substrate-binding protein [Brevibacillus borstelensis]
MKKARWWFTLAMVLAVGAAGCGPQLDQSSGGQSGGQTQAGAAPGSQSSGGEFNVGLAISLSGGTAKFGEAVKRAAQMAVDEFNEAGGADGKKAKLIVYDDEAKPEKSVEIVQRLIQQDKVVGFVGPANSGNAKAHIKFAQEAGVPEIIPVATGTTITQTYEKEDKNYIFRVAPYDKGQVETILKWVVEEKKLTKIGLLHDTTGYGQGGKTDVEGVLKDKYNMTLTATESFQVNDTNMEAQLSKMRDAQVEVVIFYGLAPEAAQYLKSRQKLNYYPLTVASWAMGDPTVKELVGDLVNKDVYMVQSFTIDQSAESKAFHDKVVAKYGEDIFPIASAQGYDCMQLILQAVKKAGTDPKAIRDAIENMTGFTGITAIGEQPFTKENHEALTSSNMFLATYRDGVIVKP